MDKDKQKEILDIARSMPLFLIRSFFIGFFTLVSVEMITEALPNGYSDGNLYIRLFSFLIVGTLTYFLWIHIRRMLPLPKELKSYLIDIKRNVKTEEDIYGTGYNEAIDRVIRYVDHTNGK